ncbi:hypothetical protein MC7420_7258 [Coleofasciculus chthonoplastes PCC 7420]|uniref:Uncharacterized protein n=1 Tax=Coleofasciculus chthonoplastes PCC 7420 TaxID=118168 RepID=B4VHM0_9CYAN|nr:hypothetical protein MC7420_7258 [Coleofasciculus chthonoplastes PCC 7420]
MGLGRVLLLFNPSTRLFVVFGMRSRIGYTAASLIDLTR